LTSAEKMNGQGRRVKQQKMITHDHGSARIWYFEVGSGAPRRFHTHLNALNFECHRPLQNGVALGAGDARLHRNFLKSLLIAVHPCLK